MSFVELQLVRTNKHKIYPCALGSTMALNTLSIFFSTCNLSKYINFVHLNYKKQQTTIKNKRKKKQWRSLAELKEYYESFNERN